MRTCTEDDREPCPDARSDVRGTLIVSEEGSSFVIRWDVLSCPISLGNRY